MLNLKRFKACFFVVFTCFLRVVLKNNYIKMIINKTIDIKNIFKKY